AVITTGIRIRQITRDDPSVHGLRCHNPSLINEYDGRRNVIGGRTCPVGNRECPVAVDFAIEFARYSGTKGYAAFPRWNQSQSRYCETDREHGYGATSRGVDS